MTLSLTGREQYYFFIGGLVSTFFCLLVVLLYFIMPKHRRRHPSQLIFYKTLSDMVYAIIQILPYAFNRDTLNYDQSTYCQAYSVVTQFAGFASDTWFFLLSVDLLLAIRNPFSSHEEYLKFYHLYAWGSSIGTAILLGSSTRWGLSMFGFCWIRQVGVNQINWVSWLNAYIPVAVYYSFSAFVLLFMYLVFQKNGLPQSDRIRRHVLVQGFRNLSLYGLYWVAYGIIWSTFFFLKGDGMTYFGVVMAYAVVIGARGVVDCLVWVLANRSAIAEGCCARRHQYKTVQDSKAEPLLTSEDMPSTFNVSYALRRDIMMCTSWGIANGIGRMTNPNLEQHTEKIIREREGKQVSFLFTSTMPNVFAELRRIWGILPEEYRKSWESSDNEFNTELLEKFTEGRSGSFFYFAHDNKYIVKTITVEEVEVLRNLLPDYVQHFRNYPDSLLARFCGLHAVQQSWENKWIHFVVMENALLSDAKITLKFDLKGSTVSRSTTKSNTIITEYKETLKDMDLKDPFRLSKTSMMLLRAQGDADSRFLEAHDIMDYSMLVGVCRRADAPSSITTEAAGVSPSTAAGMVGSPPIRSPTMGELSPAVHWRGRVPDSQPPQSPFNDAIGADEASWDLLRKRAQSADSTLKSERSEYLEEKHVPFFRQDHGGMSAAIYGLPVRVKVSIIDFLQLYNVQKKGERCLKVHLLRGGDVSVIEPHAYRLRFYRRVIEQCFRDEDEGAN